MATSWRRSLELDELRIMMTCNLPGDIMISNILPRLPVRTLFLNKIVNKTWYSLMDNRAFQELQFDMTGGHEEDRHYVVHREYMTIYVYLVSPNSCGIIDVVHGGPGTRTRIVVGCAHGVICFTPQSDNGYGFHFTLTNPTYRREYMYPEFQSRKLKGNLSLGFGYDSSNKDFKIVRIEQYEVSGQIHSIVDLYSNNTNSWRTFEATIDGLLQVPMEQLGERIGYRWTLSVSATYVNGTLNWLAARGNRSFIVSFDLNQEVFGEILLPERAPVICRQLHVWGDHLAAVYYYGRDNDHRKYFEIWMMKEYGWRRSWERVRMYGPFSSLFIFRARMANGQLMLYNTSTNKLVMYNPVGGEVSDIRIDGREWWLDSSRLDVSNYKASLIKVHGSKPFDYTAAVLHSGFAMLQLVGYLFLCLFLLWLLITLLFPDELKRL